MKKMKILYTIPNFDTAGSGKVLYDLAHGLDKDKFEVLIACANDKGAFFEEVKNLGLPIFIRPITKPLKPYYSLLFRLRENIQFIKKNNIDIPIYAIGGIRLNDLEALKQTGVYGIAISTIILESPSPIETIKEIIHIWN